MFHTLHIIHSIGIKVGYGITYKHLIQKCIVNRGTWSWATAGAEIPETLMSEGASTWQDVPLWGLLYYPRF